MNMRMNAGTRANEGMRMNAGVRADECMPRYACLIPLSGSCVPSRGADPSFWHATCLEARNQSQETPNSSPGDPKWILEARKLALGAPKWAPEARKLVPGAPKLTPGDLLELQN